MTFDGNSALIYHFWDWKITKCGKWGISVQFSGILSKSPPDENNSPDEAQKKCVEVGSHNQIPGNPKHLTPPEVQKDCSGFKLKMQM